MGIKAVIFDMDGVISDTQKIHASVEMAMLKNYGIDITAQEITRRFSGVSDKVMFGEIFADFGMKDFDLNKVVEEKWQKMAEAVKGNVEDVPGTLKFIERVKGGYFRIGVASASRISFVELVLSELGIKDSFQAITSADEVEHGKPDPAVFFLAAKKLQTAPSDCVVIEDAVSGMTAAKRAGMRCIGLVREPIQGVTYPAEVLVKDLREICTATFNVVK